MIRIIKLCQLRVIYLTFVLFIITSGKYYLNAQQIDTNKTNYMPEEEVVLSFSQVPPNSKNWIGIYKEGEIPGEIESTSWSYVGEITSGKKVFNSLSSRTYLPSFFHFSTRIFGSSTSF